MSNPTVNIIAFNTLYEILYEIKDVLKFEVKNYVNLEKFFETNKENKLAQLNYTLIFEFDNKKLIENEKIDKRKTLYFNELPIKIDSLMQRINIQIIKQKYNFHSNINIENYSLNLNTRIISKKTTQLKLTEKEIDILLFLHESKSPQKISILQKKVWGYLFDLETHTVETHVYRLRKKMKDTFQDNNFVSSNDNGYFIK
jgi:DNA-binding CsgD family transcriptional regulator